MLTKNERCEHDDDVYSFNTVAKFYIWTRPHRFTSRDVRITLQNLAENEIKK